MSNNSFKPNFLRYTKAMAEKACHDFASTTQVGFTQVLADKDSYEIHCWWFICRCCTCGVWLRLDPDLNSRATLLTLSKLTCAN